MDQFTDSVLVPNDDEDKRYFLETQNNCSDITIKRIENLKPEDFNHQAYHEFISAAPGTEGTLEAMACLINAWKRDPVNLRNLTDQIEKLTEGTYGQVYKALDGNQVSFLIKKELTGKQLSIIHEAFSGIYQINQLRKNCPNFIFTFATLFCPDTEVSTGQWCTRQGTTPYLLIENIPNSTSLRKFVEDGAEFSEILKAILQILSALNYAENLCNFTHYDLHDDNILVQELDQEIAVPLYLENKSNITKYVITKYLVRIIDYGMCFFTKILDGQEQDYYKILKKEYSNSGEKVEQLIEDQDYREMKNYPFFYPARDMATLFNCLYNDVYSRIVRDKEELEKTRLEDEKLLIDDIFEMENLRNILINTYDQSFPKIPRSLTEDQELFNTYIRGSAMSGNGYLEYFPEYRSVTAGKFLETFLSQVVIYLPILSLTDKADGLETGLCEQGSECEKWLSYQEKLFSKKYQGIINNQQRTIEDPAKLANTVQGTVIREAAALGLDTYDPTDIYKIHEIFVSDKVLVFSEFRNNFALVTKVHQGVDQSLEVTKRKYNTTLRHLLEKNEINKEYFKQLIKGIFQALSGLGKYQFIHNNLNTRNILIDRDSLDFKIDGYQYSYLKIKNQTYYYQKDTQPSQGEDIIGLLEDCLEVMSGSEGQDNDLLSYIEALLLMIRVTDYIDYSSFVSELTR